MLLLVSRQSVQGKPDPRVLTKGSSACEGQFRDMVSQYLEPVAAQQAWSV